MSVTRIDRFNQIVFGLFGLSLCVFKGGMYLFPALLFISFLLIRPKDFMQDEMLKKITFISLATFIVGFLSQLVNLSFYSDVGFYAKKAIFLFLIPVLLFYLKDKINQKILFAGFIIGLIAANFYCYYLFIHSQFTMSESLVDSFWDILRWREILTFSLCIAIPLLFHKDKKLKLFALVLILLCFPSVIFSGGRVVYFSVAISVVVYFVLLNRNKIKHFILFAVIVCALGYFIPNPVFKAIDHRVESIFNTENNYSNIGRLHMYKEGSLFIYNQLIDNPRLILFGMGEKGFNKEFVHYLEKEGKYEHLMKITSRQFSVRDQHNALLNTLSKRGVFYFILFYAMMLFLFYKTYKSAVTGNVFSQSALILLVGYVSIGMLYGNAFSFDTIIMFTLWCLFFSIGNNTVTGQRESVNEGTEDLIKGDL